LIDEDLLATSTEQENSIVEETFQCLATDIHWPSSLDSIPLVSPQQPIVPPPPTRQHPLRAILALSLHHSSLSPYSIDNPTIRAFYDNMIPYFATRLHDLALGPDVVVAITTAHRCHSLLPHDDPNTFKFHWPYDDGSITSSSTNSILSDSSRSYPLMNTDGHQVYSKVMSVEPMSLHLTDETPLDILDDPTTDYLRINVGRFIAWLATGISDDLSITHHTETGSLIHTHISQKGGRGTWPELSFFPRNGASRSYRCTEPFIVSILNTHDHCFPCRPNSSSVVDGKRWGYVVNFSLAKGFNCIKTSRINTFIRNVQTGQEFHLASQPPCLPSAAPPMGHASAEIAASIKCQDDIEATMVKGTQLYLWQHTGCPGRYDQGCFKMSSFQGHVINDNMNLQCQLRDASIRPVATNRTRYIPCPKLKNWHRVTTKDNAHLVVIAGKHWRKNTMNTDRACWVNGELPQLESA